MGVNIDASSAILDAHIVPGNTYRKWLLICIDSTQCLYESAFISQPQISDLTSFQVFYAAEIYLTSAIKESRGKKAFNSSEVRDDITKLKRSSTFSPMHSGRFGERSEHSMISGYWCRDKTKSTVRRLFRKSAQWILLKKACDNIWTLFLTCYCNQQHSSFPVNRNWVTFEIFMSHGNFWPKYTVSPRHFSV